MHAEDFKYFTQIMTFLLIRILTMELNNSVRDLDVGALHCADECSKMYLADISEDELRAGHCEILIYRATCETCMNVDNRDEVFKTVDCSFIGQCRVVRGCQLQLTQSSYRLWAKVRRGCTKQSPRLGNAR